MKIVKEQLVEMLSNKGAIITTVSIRTIPKMKKAGNPFTNVIKESVLNGVVNFNYEKAVNKQRVKEELEPTFVVKPRAWGKRIDKTPIIEHNGKFYLEMKVEKCLESKYFHGTKEIAKQDIQAFLYSTKTNHQGIENEVVVRDIALDNIKQIKLNGQCFDVVESLPSIQEIVGV